MSCDERIGSCKEDNAPISTAPLTDKPSSVPLLCESSSDCPQISPHISMCTAGKQGLTACPEMEMQVTDTLSK